MSLHANAAGDILKARVIIQRSAGPANDRSSTPHIRTNRLLRAASLPVCCRSRLLQLRQRRRGWAGADARRNCDERLESAEVVER